MSTTARYGCNIKIKAWYPLGHGDKNVRYYEPNPEKLASYASYRPV